MSGKFITFEGLDGCGKTTQLDRLASALKAAGHDVVTTREPGGTPIGERVRAILLDARTEGLSPRAELALMFAARAEHIHQVIKPALRQGKIVLCDRFTDSSEAYQGYGRQLGSDTVLKMHEVACQDFWPDLTILLMNDLAASVTRAQRRNATDQDKEGRFENEDAAFHERVQRGYEEIARRDPKRVLAVDARGTVEEVRQRIVAALKERAPGLL